VYCVWQIWQYATTAPVFSSPRVCLCPSTDHWSSGSADQSSTGHSPQDLVVLVGSHDRRLYCLSATSGSLRWCRELDSELYSSPNVFQRNSHSAVQPVSGAGGQKPHLSVHKETTGWLKIKYPTRQYAISPLYSVFTAP